MSQRIQTAELDWQRVDAIDVPVSKKFGDVYFSKDNGLLESRHVFLNGNDLSERLAQLDDYAYFSVAETGFGTGLNILALWQLWQQQRPENHSHLHAISVEKYPLSRTDLIRALAAWPELKALSDQLIALYPLPLAGCHRLNFPNERFSIDLWFGDAQDIFPEMIKTHAIDAWFLDGFAPSCNPDLWEAQVLEHIIRLSDVGTTFASFSVAGVLKRGLQKHGIQITRPRGFAHKREMLKAVWPNLNANAQAIDHANAAEKCEAKAEIKIEASTFQSTSTSTSTFQSTSPPTQRGQRRIAVIGAGIAGLSSAYAFAQRGHSVDLYDQSSPIAGASGNPLALINPMLCPADQSASHLMCLSWQFALQYYARFAAFRALQVNQLVLKEPDQAQLLVEDFPEQQLLLQHAADHQRYGTLKTQFDSVKLASAAAIQPKKLADEILAHPLIQFKQATLSAVESVQDAHLGRTKQRLKLKDLKPTLESKLESAPESKLESAPEYDHVIICCGCATQTLIDRHPPLKPNRGQVSWLDNRHAPLPLNQAYSYGGYCMQLDAQQLILGASFYPHRDDRQVEDIDHVHNYELIHNAFPDYAARLATPETWQGRASIRAQSADYFPFAGKVNLDQEIYSFSGLGSKGFLFAPLLSEVLAAMVLGEHYPMSATVFHKVNPQRFFKKARIRKPYYQGPYAKTKTPPVQAKLDVETNTTVNTIQNSNQT